MNKIYINIKDFQSILFYLLGSIIFIILLYLLVPSHGTHGDFELYIASFISLLICISSFYFIYKIEGHKFSLSSIVVFIFILFNFGQVLFWGIGIHTATEIGKQNLFVNYPKPSITQIIDAIKFSLSCLITICASIGFAIIVNSGNRESTYSEIDNEIYRKIIYRLSVILGIVVIPLTLIGAVLSTVQSLAFGYISLYYSDFSLPTIVNRAEDFFFPVLVGLLLGSKYEKRKLVYIIFGLYIIINLFAGERGNWFYRLIILFWMHNHFYKKISVKQLIKLIIIGMIFLFILGGIVDLRGQGLANVGFDDFVSKIFINNNPILRFVFEMGNSLGVTIIVLSEGMDRFSLLGNTFVTDFMGGISSKFASILGFKPVVLANYLSNDVIHISWGSGFNLFGECFINGGYAGWLYLIPFGVFCGFVLKNSDKSDSNHVYRSFLSCVAAGIICSMVRDSALNGFRQLIQVMILVSVIINILHNLVKIKAIRTF